MTTTHLNSIIGKYKLRTGWFQERDITIELK